MWKTIGQIKAIDLFERALERSALAHAYLITGPPQVGKMTLALDLAMKLNCMAESHEQPCGECIACKKIVSGVHADIQVVSLNQVSEAEEAKSRTEIGIERIKDMLHSTSLPPFEGKYRVYIIEEAGSLSPDAANRLLKTLEEPIGKVVFLLLTENSRAVPPTVVSRCQKIDLYRMNLIDIEAVLIGQKQLDAENARLLARLSHGCPGWAFKASENSGVLLERKENFEKMRNLMHSSYSERFSSAAQLALQFGKKRDTVYEILEAWICWWRDILLVKAGCDSYIVNIDLQSALVEMAGDFKLDQIKLSLNSIRAAKQQLKLNANPRLVLETLMLNLPERLKNQKTGLKVEVKNA